MLVVHGMLYSVLVIILKLDCAKTTLVNVALKKPARQSSTFDAKKNPATKANDGNYGNHCAYTSSQTANWWIVDLLHVYDIHTIRIKNNPSSTFSTKLTNFYVYVSTLNPLPIPPDDNNYYSFTGELCLHYPNNLPQNVIQELHCNYNSTHPLKGRYVYLWKPEHEELMLCEFEVLVAIDDCRKATGKLEHQRTKSSLTPIYSDVQNPNSNSLSNCFVTCMSAFERGDASHFQVNRRSGRCECLQYSDLVHANLELSSDDEIDLYAITDIAEV